MKKVVLCIFFLFFLSIGFGQANSKLDSLKKVLAKLPAEGSNFASDTMRVKVMCEIGNSILVFYGDSALVLFTKGLNISEKINWKKGKYKSYLGLGFYQVSKNIHTTAIDFYYKALMNCAEDQEFGAIYRYLGDSYSMAGDFDKALYFNLKSIDIYKKIKDNFNVIHGYNNLGLVYFDKMEYIKAIEIFNQALKANLVFKDKNLQNYLNLNLGFSLLKNGNLDLAFPKLNDYILSRNGKFEYSEIIVFVSLAEYYLQKGNILKAKESLRNATIISDTYNKVEEAEFEISEIGYRIFKKTNEYSRALIYLENYNRLKDQKTAQSTKRRLETLQFEFDNKEKEKEISSLNQTKKNGIFALLLISGVGFVLFLLNSKLRKTNIIINNQKLEIEDSNRKLENFNLTLEAKVAKRTAELSDANKELVLKNFEITEALFKGQTIERKRVAAELHDNLGSTLSALKWRLGALDSDKLNTKEKEIYESIKNMMGSAYNDVRNISHNLLPAEFEKYGLLGALKKLVNEINSNQNIEIKIETESYNNINKGLELETYSIILELINNIIKHSLAKKALIKLTISSGTLKIVVADDGIGFTEKNSKFGINNIKNRIDRIHGRLEIVLNTKWSTEFLISVELN